MGREREGYPTNLRFFPYNPNGQITSVRGGRGKGKGFLPTTQFHAIFTVQESRAREGKKRKIKHCNQLHLIEYLAGTKEEKGRLLYFSIAIFTETKNMPTQISEGERGEKGKGRSQCNRRIPGRFISCGRVVYTKRKLEKGKEGRE